MLKVLPSDLQVLVADDMLTMRLLIVKELRKIEISKVVEAVDGQDAWTRIMVSLENDTPFDLVICDWKMPGMLGIELLRKVRVYDKMKHTPFIMITAESKKEDMIEVVQAGVSGVVLKPFTGATLRNKVLQVWEAFSTKAA